MPVDSYRYLPRSFREGFEAFPIQETEPVRADLAVATARSALTGSVSWIGKASNPSRNERGKYL